MTSKRCGCGIEHDARAWQALPFVGYQDFPAEGTLPSIRLELRNCPCGSTLALRVSITREAA